MVVGSAEEITSRMEAWFGGEGAEGFNVMPPDLSGSARAQVRYRG